MMCARPDGASRPALSRHSFVRGAWSWSWALKDHRSRKSPAQTVQRMLLSLLKWVPRVRVRVLLLLLQSMQRGQRVGRLVA